ncbi:hypothetical protein T484DRAFT_1931497 [Baffinella frigidus]|nr:hypothetical protein T484DRAFT_1931497 [Cryptophyta sp. CCMP2293]
MPRKALGKRDNDLGGLIGRLEGLQEELNPNKSQEPEEETDSFSKLRKLAARQVNEIRAMITEREELLEASAGSGGRQSVILSSKIRETIRGVQGTHREMQDMLALEQQQASKGKSSLLSEDDMEQRVATVELTGKHIVECEALEKRRYQSRSGNRQGLITGKAGGGPMSEIRRSGNGGGLHGSGGGGGGGGGGGSDLDPIDSEIGDGLVQIRKNDQVLDEQLEMVSKGMVRLKGIATDQQIEVKVQEAMIEVIDGEMDTATAKLNQVNVQMKETLKNAGGATALLVKMCLVILVLAIAAYLYRMLA